MKRIALLLVTLSVLAAACADPAGTGSTTSSTVPPPASVAGPSADEPLLMGLALSQLIGTDNSFGPEQRFSRALIQTRTDPAAGFGTSAGSSRPLTAAERAAIEDTVASFAPVQWIDDPDEWRTDDLRPVIGNSVILGVGEVTFDDAGALVPVSLWCGGLCGTWFTYRIEMVDGEWTVTGFDGPMTIS